jgi:hypothetical protein
MTEPTALRDHIRRVLARIDGFDFDSLEPHDYQIQATAILAELQPELVRLADYENRITWDTTCASCARILDSSIRETERAEKAEAAIDRVKAACDQLHRASVLADGEPHTDRERGVMQAVRRVLNALEWPAAAQQQQPKETQIQEPCGAREPEPRTGTSPCVLPAGHGGTRHQDKWTNQWPAVAQQQPKEAAPAVPQCDGCGHLVHRARKCPAVRYGERCECDEPLATDGEARP